jgi:hypothetical protein
MMPLFFPFTYLPPESAAALQICFERLTVLQPLPGRLPAHMKRLQASGWLDVRAPQSVDAARLEKIISGIRTWADLNRGSRGLDTGFFQSMGDRIPLFDDTTPSRIRDAIRSRKHQGHGKEDSMGIIADLVFLSMAEQYDIQSRAISEGLDGLTSMEADLFDRLKGVENGMQRPSAPPAGREVDASADYMLAERLAAWRRVAGAVFDADMLPAVAVTTRRAVVDSLKENTESLHEVVCMEAVACGEPSAAPLQDWRLELAAYLQQLVGGEDPTGIAAPGAPPEASTDRNCFSLRLYVTAGVDLKNLLDSRHGGHLARQAGGNAACTVVALVQC